MSIGYSRYGIAWKRKISDYWQLWVAKTEDAGYNPVLFQYYSDCDHISPNAKDYMEKYVESEDVDCKIVEIDMNVYEVDFYTNRGLVRGKAI